MEDRTIGKTPSCLQGSCSLLGETDQKMDNFNIEQNMLQHIKDVNMSIQENTSGALGGSVG